jgi:XTP/dITP diphosphohydrolase
MNLWIATGNKGKLGEFKTLLDRDVPTVKVYSTMDLKVFSAPPENGATYLDNARIKAKSLRAMKPEDWVLADDSGLEVEALNNLPGVHSARYAGAHARDSENVAKLLKMMQLRAGPNRTAKFVCTIVAYAPQAADGSYEEFVFTSEMKGVINKNPVGQMGFGYDPVFIPDGENKSMAELGSGYKNRFSHRAKATLQFIEMLKTKAEL